MNKELIQKFLNKACWDEQAQHELEDWLNVEKFAELIVQECIDIISPYTVRMSRPGEKYLHPIQEIRKNFGVE